MPVKSRGHARRRATISSKRCTVGTAASPLCRSITTSAAVGSIAVSGARPAGGSPLDKRACSSWGWPRPPCCAENTARRARRNSRHPTRAGWLRVVRPAVWSDEIALPRRRPGCAENGAAAVDARPLRWRRILCQGRRHRHGQGQEHHVPVLLIAGAPTHCSRPRRSPVRLGCTPEPGNWTSPPSRTPRTPSHSSAPTASSSRSSAAGSTTTSDRPGPATPDRRGARPSSGSAP